jgi:hypothetical protein
MTQQRRNPATSVETQVLTASQRKCCLCYYLAEVRTHRKGQIAHLNQDPSNSDFENLVWLCLEHHDEFDSQTSQSKGFTVQEVKTYRDRLYRELGSVPENENQIRKELKPIEMLPDELRSVVKQSNGQLDYLLTPWRVVAWQDVSKFLFAFKSSNRCDGICRIERLFLRDGRVAVICSAIKDAPGQSITNTLEEIAFQVCANFEIDPAKLVWIEHYPFYPNSNGELEWSLVSFQSRPPASMFHGPSWRKMTEQDWRALGLRPRGRRKAT